MKAFSFGFAVVATLACATASAQSTPEIFEGADLALGERLLKENRCAQCHEQKFGGEDGSDIYRPRGRINTPGALRGMVEQCNTQPGLTLFPEEVTAIAAVLNRDHYRLSR